MRRKYIPKDMFIIWVGAEPFACRYLSTFVKTLGYRPYQIKSIYNYLKKRRFWSTKDGSIIIKKIPWLDYLPKAKGKAYDQSLPEYRWDTKIKDNGNSSK